MMKNKGYIGIMENILETTIEFRAYWLPGLLPEGSTSMLYIDIYTHIYVSIYIYMYVCSYLCASVYIYICVYTLLAKS